MKRRQFLKGFCGSVALGVGVKADLVGKKPILPKLRDDGCRELVYADGTPYCTEPKPGHYSERSQGVVLHYPGKPPVDIITVGQDYIIVAPMEGYKEENSPKLPENWRCIVAGVKNE